MPDIVGGLLDGHTFSSELGNRLRLVHDTLFELFRLVVKIPDVGLGDEPRELDSVDRNGNEEVGELTPPDIEIDGSGFKLLGRPGDASPLEMRIPVLLSTDADSGSGIMEIVKRGLLQRVPGALPDAESRGFDVSIVMVSLPLIDGAESVEEGTNARVDRSGGDGVPEGILDTEAEANGSEGFDGSLRDSVKLTTGFVAPGKLLIGGGSNIVLVDCPDCDNVKVVTGHRELGKPGCGGGTSPDTTTDVILVNSPLISDMNSIVDVIFGEPVDIVRKSGAVEDTLERVLNGGRLGVMKRSVVISETAGGIGYGLDGPTGGGSVLYRLVKVSVDMGSPNEPMIMLVKIKEDATGGWSLVVNRLGDMERTAESNGLGGMSDDAEIPERSSLDEIELILAGSVNAIELSIVAGEGGWGDTGGNPVIGDRTGVGIVVIAGVDKLKEARPVGGAMLFSHCVVPLITE